MFHIIVKPSVCFEFYDDGHEVIHFMSGVFQISFHQKQYFVDFFNILPKSPTRDYILINGEKIESAKYYELRH